MKRRTLIKHAVIGTAVGTAGLSPSEAQEVGRDDSPNRIRLSGIFVPVVTPFKNDDLSIEDLRDTLRQFNRTGLTGYLALGSNAEFRSLMDTERMRVLEVFTAEKGDKVVLAGTACESTRETIVKSREAARMGFDYVIILTPSYFAKRMNGPTIKDYYLRIAEAITIPVLLYDAPQYASGVQIPPKIVTDLSRHPNIVGMKESSAIGPGPVLDVLDPDVDFSVLAGSANFMYPSFKLGASGGVTALGNVLPEPCCELYRLFRAGRNEKGLALHRRLSRLNTAISGALGVSGIKAAMDMLGFRGGEPRHPLKPVSAEIREAIRSLLKHEGFI
ncbi:dihydrodipicolinate synthase family protein [Candidatus Latescibacterota bacterium]